MRGILCVGSIIRLSPVYLSASTSPPSPLHPSTTATPCHVSPLSSSSLVASSPLWQFHPSLRALAWSSSNCSCPPLLAPPVPAAPTPLLSPARAPQRAEVPLLQQSCSVGIDCAAAEPVPVSAAPCPQVFAAPPLRLAACRGCCSTSLSPASIPMVAVVAAVVWSVARTSAVSPFAG